MKEMKSVLLVFDDQKELEFMEANLIESGVQVFKSDNLKSALTIAEQKLPDLIVVNTLDSEFVMELFGKQIKERLKNAILLCFIELENYLKTSTKEHLVVKPVRPKLVLSLIRNVINNEETNWLPAFH